MASSAAKAAMIQAPVRLLERRIYVLRGQKVMLDEDLAELYGVPTKRLNEQVRRNRTRFPKDFMFPVDCDGGAKLEVANCDFKLGRKKNQAAGVYGAWGRDVVRGAE